MESTEQQTQQRSIDVTGLPDEAVMAVESLVSLLRSRNTGKTEVAVLSSYEEWSKVFWEWIGSHPKRNTPADDSRESIYAGRGE